MGHHSDSDSSSDDEGKHWWSKDQKKKKDKHRRHHGAHNPYLSEQLATHSPLHTPVFSPSGHRVPMSTESQLPFPFAQIGAVAFYDADGTSPTYIGSAIMERSVQPCKVAPNLAPSVCRVTYGGVEIEHRGRYDILPTNNEIMEWVNTGYGRIPDGRRPVEGGFEETGEKLYHGVALVQDEPVLWVLGKCGEHLVSAGKLVFVPDTRIDRHLR